MMNILDIRMVILGQLITDIVCVSVLLFLWFQNRKRFEGIIYWLFDLALQTTGILLVLLRGQIPDWFSIGFSNPLVIGGAYLGYLGLERFIGKTSARIYNFVFLIGFVLINSYFTFLQSNLDIRNDLLSIGLFVVSFQCVWLVLHRLEARERRKMLAVAAVFGGFCALSLTKIVIIFLLPAPVGALFRSDLADAFARLINQVLLILLTFSLVLLINDFLVSEAKVEGEAFIKIFQKSVVALSLADFEKETFIDVNDEWLRMTGFSRNEVIGKNEGEVKVWKDPRDWDKLKQNLMEKNEIHNLEVQRYRKSGEELTDLMTAQTINLWGRQTLLISSLDVTERKQAEQEQRQSQENFYRAFNSNPAALAITRLDDGKFIVVNESYMEIMGYKREDILGHTVSELNIYADPEERTRLIQRLHNQGTIRNYELLVHSHTGELRSLLLSMEPIVYDKEDCILSTFIDITGRKKAEQEILSLNERLHILITAIQELAAARDLEAVMAAVRTSARKLTGSDGSTFVLRDNDQCYYADEDAISPLWKGQRFPLTACISGWTMLNKQPAVIEDIYADPRVPIDTYKPTFVKSLAMVPIRTHDPLGAIGNYWAQRHQPTEMEVQLVQTLADAAARAVENVRLLEELEQRVQERTAQLEIANHELEAFSYSVSHDLRAPLRAMSGFSRILSEDYETQMPPEATRYLGLIDQNAGQMGELIDDLLRFSRLSRQQLNKQSVTMDEMVRQVLEELQAVQEGKEVEITIGKLPECQADPALLKQVWVNLLSNALKFTRKCGAAKIEVGYLPHPKLPAALTSTHPATKFEGNGGGAYFVKDNGVGFDMQYVNKLFGVFQRLHRAEDYEGTGVGLAIVQRVIHRHGGRVWAEAEVDKGATFYFTLGGNDDEK